MAQEINTTSVSLNNSSAPAQYFADYNAIVTSDLPALCALPPAVTFNLPEVPLIPLAPNCEFQFPDVIITPPVYVPDVYIPFACGSVGVRSNIKISGNAITGSLTLNPYTGDQPGGSCGVSFDGFLNVDACASVGVTSDIKFPEGSKSTLTVEPSGCNFKFKGNFDFYPIDKWDQDWGTIIWERPDLFPNASSGGGGGGGSSCFLEVNTERPSTKNKDTAPDKLKVRPSQFETEDGDQWPSNMSGGSELSLAVPSEGKSYVYLQLSTRPDYSVSSGTIIQSSEKLRTTVSNKHNHLLATITAASNDKGAKKVLKIANTCTPPPKTFSIDCPFHMTDATNIGGTPTVRIRSTSVWDIYPYGMRDDDFYYYPLDGGSGTKLYMYLLSHTLPSGELDVDAWGEYAMEIKAEKAPKKPEDSSAALRWEQFGTVTIGTVPTGFIDSGRAYCKKIVNFCSLQNPSTPDYSAPFLPNNVCSFAITNASGSTTGAKSLKVRINASKVPSASSDPKKQYPVGMSEDKPYQEFNIPSNTYWVGVYLALHLFDDYTIDYGVVELLDAEHTPRNTSRIVYKVIGEIYTNYSTGAVTTKSTCPQIEDNYQVDCPFHISDAGESSIRIRSTKVMGTYPKDMLDTTKTAGAFHLDVNPGWNAIYLKMHLTDSGYLAKKTFGGSVMQIVAMDDYVYEEGNTGYLRWELLGEVTVSEDENGVTYCSYIQNNCNMPNLPAAARNSCPFQVYDASELDPNSGKLKLKYGVAKGTVNSIDATNKYPKGMEDEEYFVRDVTSTNAWFAVYLVLRLASDFSIRDATIEECTYYKTSTDTLIYHLIAGVNVATDSENYGKYISFIQNSCNAPKNDYKFNDCPFYIINAGPNSVRIASTSVEGIYPLGMEEDTVDSTPFYLGITEEKPLVYLKINKDFQGNIDVKNYSEAALEIEMVKDYKTAEDNNALLQWEYLGEARHKQVDEGDTYTEVTNQCGYPSVYATPVDCAWKAFDISTPTNNGDLEVMVRVRGSQLIDADGNELWPKGLTDTKPWTDIIPAEGEFTIVYLVLLLDYKYEIESADIRVYNNYKNNTASKVYHPIAEVVVSNDTEGGQYISSLVNYCQEPLRSYNVESCPFYLQDDSSATKARVRVANTWVYDRETYPKGMDMESAFSLDLNDSAWYGIYLKVLVDGDGMLDISATDPLEIKAEDTPKNDSDPLNDTIFKKWFFLGELTIDYDTEGNPFCGWIRNNCESITFPIDTGNTSTCPFGVTGKTEGDSEWKVKIGYGTIRGIEPEGMSTDADYVLDWADGIVVMLVTFKAESIDIENISFDIMQAADIINTDTVAYYAIASLDTYVDGDGENAPNITNYCYMPDPCVCDLVYKAGSQGE
jgi:hypothetical protein